MPANTAARKQERGWATELHYTSAQYAVMGGGFHAATTATSATTCSIPARFPQGLVCDVRSCTIWLRWNIWCLLYSDLKSRGISPMSEHSSIFLPHLAVTNFSFSSISHHLKECINVSLLMRKAFLILPMCPCLSSPINSHCFIPSPFPSQTSIIWPLKPRPSGERCFTQSKL